MNLSIYFNKKIFLTPHQPTIAHSWTQAQFTVLVEVNIHYEKNNLSCLIYSVLPTTAITRGVSSASDSPLLEIGLIPGID